ncbi:helix-turn-helix domain-containing protein, partial [Neobacillus niacini]|uniref:PucR family transcriptional regulator n=1 Tax=Neobacillus niacini TaxID=86668 RepID=UPI0030039C02
EEYDETFINNGEVFGIDLSIERRAFVIKSTVNKNIPLHDQEFVFRLNPNLTLFIVPCQNEIIKRIEKSLANYEYKIGIGNPYTQVNTSVHEAKRAIEIADKLGMNQIHCDYKDLKFIDYLTNKDNSLNDMNNFYQELEENSKGRELMETLISYITNSGDMNAISKELHIHRNSLTYRLQKIEILTNKNPKKFTDLFELFTGYVLYKMQTS